MIKSLNERIQEHKERYLKMQTAEHVAETHLKNLEHLLNEKSTLTTYDGSVYIYLYPPSIDVAELNMVPAISEIYGPHWTKIVEVTSVTYRFGHYIDDIFLVIRIQPMVAGTCQIVARATGKIRKTSKYVEVEEPEVEYEVNCSEEEGL